MLGLGKRLAAMYGTGDEAGGEGQPGQENKNTGPGEAGKLGLAVGLLAIALVIGLYVAHDMRFAAIQSDFNDKLTSVAVMDARLGSLEKRLGAIEALPEMARKMYLNTAIADMKQRAAALGDLASEEQKAALAKVEEILSGMQQAMPK